MLSDALDEKVRAGKGWYGTNMRPAFVDMIQLKTMDSRLIPQDGDKNRLIFIGDVHGCYDERESSRFHQRTLSDQASKEPRLNSPMMSGS